MKPATDEPDVLAKTQGAQDENVRLRAALTYARRGWHVFPLHTPADEQGCSCRKADCKDQGKHPRTLNGLKDATTNETQIRSWWEMWPEANIGISCGPSGLVVVDVDPRHGGDESFRDLVEDHGDEWLATVTAQTGGGGGHYLYLQPAEKRVRNATGIFPGIDLRGDGGYIVAPPSRHISGGSYSWERTANESELLPFPENIFKVTQKASSAPSIGEIIPMGKRDETLTSLAGTMRRRGMGEGAILAALREENAARCEPPLPDGALVRIARSVVRYAPSEDILLKVRSGAPMYGSLRKHLTEPPMYVLRVGETDVRVTMAVLRNHNALRTAIAEQADILVPGMKAIEWDNQLSALLAQVEVIEAPDDASDRGLAWTAICEALRQRTENEERFAQGKPYEHDKQVYVTGAMLRDILRARGLNLEQRSLWEVVREHGGENTTARINGRVFRTWTIPVAEVDR